MIACLVLGMGMPTVPAYLIIVLVMGPAIRELGIPPLLVHLFVLYFGVLSSITPPVAIAAYAAAPIAGSNPIVTAVVAVRLALIGFIIPFVFVYNPSLVLVAGLTAPGLAWVVARLILAIWLFSTAFGGFDRGPISLTSRVLRPLMGVLMLAPNFGLELGAFVLALAWLNFPRGVKYYRRLAGRPALESEN